MADGAGADEFTAFSGPLADKTVDGTAGMRYNDSDFLCHPAWKINDGADSEGVKMAHQQRMHRGHGGRHGGKPSRARLLLMGAAAVVVFAAGLLAISFVGGRLEGETEETRGNLEERFAPTLTLEHDGRTYAHEELDYTTILFIGVDKSELSSASMRTGGQADFLLLMTIDRERREIDLLQIDRDTITPVKVYGAFGNPAGTRNTQISLSYAFGTNTDMACRNTVQAVTTLLHGIPIDHYIALDMDGMSILNDALGGVTVTLEEDFSDLDPAMTAGTTLKLQGRQAAYYLRSRMTVGDGTNAGRMKRQATFLSAAATLLDARMAEDPEFVDGLLDALEEHLVLSCQESWLINQAYAARKYARTEIVRPEGESLIGADGFAEFHPDADALMTYIIGTFCK